MTMGERLEAMRFLVRDRGGQFTGAFDAVFESCGLRVLKSPPRAPRANAICERRIGTLRCEVLDHLLILNETHLRTVLAQFAAHYNPPARIRALPSASRMTTREPDRSSDRPGHRSDPSKTRPRRPYKRISDSCVARLCNCRPTTRFECPSDEPGRPCRLPDPPTPRVPKPRSRDPVAPRRTLTAKSRRNPSRSEPVAPQFSTCP